MSLDLKEYLKLFDAPDLTEKEKLDYLRELEKFLQTFIDQASNRYSVQQDRGYLPKGNLQSPKDSIELKSTPLSHSFRKPATFKDGRLH